MFHLVFFNNFATLSNVIFTQYFLCLHQFLFLESLLHYNNSTLLMYTNNECYMVLCFIQFLVFFFVLIFIFVLFFRILSQAFFQKLVSNR